MQYIYAYAYAYAFVYVYGVCLCMHVCMHACMHEVFMYVRMHVYCLRGAHLAECRISHPQPSPRQILSLPGSIIQVCTILVEIGQRDLVEEVFALRCGTYPCLNLDL